MGGAQNLALKSETLFRQEVITSLFAMDEQLKFFGRNVLAQMNHRGLTTAALAKKAGIAPKTLNNLLIGRHAPQSDVLVKIAKALKVEFWQLWLPDFPVDMAHDETFPKLIQTASKLSPDALKSIARMATLELEAAENS
jgi:transcriptional regulator with XRE-family HTH domain